MGIMYECVCCKNGLLWLLKWVVLLEKSGRFCRKNLSFLFEKRPFLHFALLCNERLFLSVYMKANKLKQTLYLQYLNYYKIPLIDE